MGIGNSFYRVESFSDNALDEENQYLAKVTIVNPADYVISANEDGTLQYEEKVSSGDKYRLEPEGELFRLYALRTIPNGICHVRKGSRGGLVANGGNLSQEGTCWIQDGAKVIENVQVSGDCYVYGYTHLSGDGRVMDVAQVCDSTATGRYLFGHNARIVDTTVNGEAGGFNVGGDTQLNESEVITTKDGFRLHGGCVQNASLRSNHDIVSAWTRFGWLSAFRAKGGQLNINVGCQRHGDMDQLRAEARDQGCSDVELAMLDHFIALAQTMASAWTPPPVSIPRLGEPIGSVPELLKALNDDN